MADGWEQQPRERPRPWRAVAIVLAAVAVSGVLLRPSSGEDDVLPVQPALPAPPADAPTRAPGPAPSGVGGTLQAPQDGGAALPGQWIELADAPIDAPDSHVGVWTGTELVVGFQPEVAAFDPDAGTWRMLPPVPGPPRDDPLVVLAGGRIAVFGGHPGEAEPHRADGALLDLGTERWQPIPEAPAAPLWDPAVVWTGDELLVWGGARPGDAHALGRWPVRGSAFDPATGSWRLLPRAPVTHVYRSTGVWTGEELLVWGGHQPPDARLQDEAGLAFAAAYDPVRDIWRLLPAPPFNDPTLAATVWTGDAALLLGARAPTARDVSGDRIVAFGVALRPGGAEGAWRRLASLGGGYRPPRDFYGFGSAWTGSEAVLYGGYSAMGLVYALAADCWALLPPHRPRRGAVVAWTGAEVLVWGGFTNVSKQDLWAYRPRDPLALGHGRGCAKATPPPSSERP